MTETGFAAKATFAAGCFWGIEETFRNLPGVLMTTAGYTGGHLSYPSYRQVCTDRTGHAEAVEVIYLPEVISYEELLEVFFACHDPTTLNRQGGDVGTQYRSAIYWHTHEQERAAIMSRDAHAIRFSSPIVTEITPVTEFYPAEEYHQLYLLKQGVAAIAS
ncbi:peptide-methionine (S)-S-oxide reductase MsrA [Vulgatibacter incomptus]|uniref:Peptide methionine sulfoxide reductase MsrA n=1 Tax=Vulgatibacter incomptus TaxID=1391653 RepID=A0A0K1P8U1_9BACT|nr:peptide-methionine (S)-S-oxide reductase MsrA [Vulgatibacter incomptus]AKU89826.1 Peptide methionine sulfoxide reductase MsrA [Vulgatibacter incomptus]